MTKKVLWLCLLVLILCNTTGYCGGSGTTAVNFLKIGVGARAAGLGEAYSAIADDATALYWNPAGIAQLNQREAALTHLLWLENINYSYVGFVQPLPKDKIGTRTLGISAAYLSSGKIVGRDYSDTNNTEYSAYDLAIGFSYGQSIGKDLSVGATLKLVTENIEQYNGRTTALDVGILYRYQNNISFGGCVQNLGTKFVIGRQEEIIPLIVRAGAKMNMPNTLLSMDLVKPSDNNLNVNVGAEYTINELCVVRLGYKYRMGGNDSLGGVNNLSVGAGIKYKLIQIDYAFVPYGDLSPVTHRVSLNIKFGSIKPILKNKAVTAKPEEQSRDNKPKNTEIKPEIEDVEMDDIKEQAPKSSDRIVE